MNVDWKLTSYSLSWLRKQAHDYRHHRNIFDWLRAIGVVPEGVRSAPVAVVRVDLPADDIKAGYLASCAYEWDSWGASSPVDFINALSFEVAGSKQKDIVAAVLTSLGRASMQDLIDMVGGVAA